MRPPRWLPSPTCKEVSTCPCSCWTTFRLFLNSFLSSGLLPSAWKTTTVVPIYKWKGQSSDPANYRPVSLTSVFCKLLERVLSAELSEYLLSKGLISRHQHGFISKHCTTTNLIESLNDWTLAIDNKLTESSLCRLCPRV
jgi:hypothetical protein